MKKIFVGTIFGVFLCVPVCGMELVPAPKDVFECKVSLRERLDRILAQAEATHVFLFDPCELSLGLSVRDCAGVAEKIKKLSPLNKIIFFCMCHIERTGVKELFGALQQHDMISELDFSFNPGFCIDEVRTSILASMLSTMRHLTTFKLRSSELARASSASVQTLLNALSKTQVATLDLSFNRLNVMADEEPFSSLMSGLAVLPGLKSLSVRSNNVSLFQIQQWRAFCSMLSAARSLRSLDVSENGLGACPVSLYWEFFWETIADLPIEELNIAHNWFDALDQEDDWDIFTSAIARMKQLKRLDMRGCGMSQISQERQSSFMKALLLCAGKPVLVLRKQDDIKNKWSAYAAFQKRFCVVFEE